MTKLSLAEIQKMCRCGQVWAPGGPEPDCFTGEAILCINGVELPIDIFYWEPRDCEGLEWIRFDVTHGSPQWDFLQDLQFDRFKAQLWCTCKCLWTLGEWDIYWSNGEKYGITTYILLNDRNLQLKSC